jgi:hypothetical protein
LSSEKNGLFEGGRGAEPEVKTVRFEGIRVKSEKKRQPF